MAFTAIQRGTLLLLSIAAASAQHQGIVRFHGQPVPGAVITATEGAASQSTITSREGTYELLGLGAGEWTIRVELPGFGTQERLVKVDGKFEPVQWALAIAPDGSPLPVVAGPRGGAALEVVQPPLVNPQAADSMLIAGSANNAALSPFAQPVAFGNVRRSRQVRYHGNLGAIVGDSALDARPFSITGQDSPKPAYTRFTGVASLGGPARIPWIPRSGFTFSVNYQWTRTRNITLLTGLMPTAAQRAGDLSSSPGPFHDPASGVAFPDNQIPQDRITPQARALLALYPLPNLPGGSRFNYQVPSASAIHQDNFQARVDHRIGNRDHVAARLDEQSSRNDSASIFNFVDRNQVTGINAATTWRHSVDQRLFFTLGLEFSSLRTRTLSNFSGRENISANAGIAGNNQEPLNWGPPNLAFASGIASLSDVPPAYNRNQSVGISQKTSWNRGLHNYLVGGDFRRKQFNWLSDADPRGTLVFTGARTGSDFAGFLLGSPDTSSISFGHADKYLRASAYSAFVNDDWRLAPGLTLNAGLRWEYSTPLTERYGRLVNLGVSPDFTSATAQLASGAGPNANLPASLVNPYRRAFAPRVGVAWRPQAGSSLVVRVAYGVYFDTALYDDIAQRMAQQPPLSNTFVVGSSDSHPLTIADPFRGAVEGISNTFAADPRVRPGSAQNWQLLVQRDIPLGMVLSASYLGIKGTHTAQQSLPNTYPVGASNPCSSCPIGFVYLSSSGNSTRQAGQVQLRRRMRSGFSADLSYAFSKSLDNSSLGASVRGDSGIAQNWLDFRSERSLSSFDQRHLLSGQVQFTSGMGAGAGSLLSGWRGAALKRWTFSTQWSAGTGLPLNPLYLAAVPGTGITGSLRPDYTGAGRYSTLDGHSLNRNAYAVPTAGRWGNAGRNSITGPKQLTLNGSISRVFQMGDRYSGDLRLDAVNPLNHPTFPGWNTSITSLQFGLPGSANPMRSVQTTFRVRF